MKLTHHARKEVLGFGEYLARDSDSVIDFPLIINSWKEVNFQSSVWYDSQPLLDYELIVGFIGILI